MAVIDCREIADERRGPTFDGDGSLHRRYTRTFRVVTDSYFTGGLQALVQGFGIPKLYSYYDTRPHGGIEFDLGAILVGYDTNQPDKDTPNLWHVRCDYASRSLNPNLLSRNLGASPDHQGGGDHNENPILRPAVITYRNNNQRRTLSSALGKWIFDAEPGADPAPRFISGTTRIANAAGTAYNPGPEVPAPQKTITFVKNRPSYDVRDKMFYEGKVNSVPWLGFDTATVYCDFIDAEGPLIENNVVFVRTTYQFQLRRSNFYPDSPGEPWDWAVVNQGPQFFDSEGQIQDARDGNGNPRIVYLDRDGAILDAGADPDIIAFRVFDRADFNDLQLP